MEKLVKNAEGKWTYHGMTSNQCNIYVDRSSHFTLWQVQRPDGVYAKNVGGSFATEQAALDYVAANGWEVR
jgi:protein associated with RNAse G/E